MNAVAILAACVLATCETAAAESGHHYSYLEGAQIGHDFGRNPFASGSSDAASLGFATAFGRSRLTAALENAVAAGESRMSFDLGFDFRSVVRFENGLATGLDDWAFANVDAFLDALRDADRSAQAEGRRLAADVVLVDHRVADGVSREGAFTIGEHPEVIADPEARRALIDALRPVLKRLASSDRVTVNLMNEPEFVSMPALEAAKRLRAGRLGRARFVLPDGRQKPVSGIDVAALFETSLADRHVRIARDGGATHIALTELTSTDLRQFLVDLWRAVIEAGEVQSDFDGDGDVGFQDFLAFAGAFGSRLGDTDWHPACDLDGDGEVAFADFVLFSADYGRGSRRPEVTIGWADDRSALENTPLIESLAGDRVTDTVSFHVYDTPENAFHPLTTTMADFVQAGYGDRAVRITEWGLGGLQGEDAIEAGIRSALASASVAGFGGVLFWWDDVHAYSYGAYSRQMTRFPASASARQAAVSVGRF